MSLRATNREVGRRILDIGFRGLRPWEAVDRDAFERVEFAEAVPADAEGLLAGAHRIVELSHGRDESLADARQASAQVQLTLADAVRTVDEKARREGLPLPKLSGFAAKARERNESIDAFVARWEGQPPRQPVELSAPHEPLDPAVAEARRFAEEWARQRLVAL